VDNDTARDLARGVADSALVRASFYGGDPNWGRIVGALGASGIEIDPRTIKIAFAGTVVADEGVASGADEDEVAAALAEDFDVEISVGGGRGRARLLTTDLTPEYVRFNGERS
jgi:glutamate N-acetyltransferase/amino-acid N-acetyltransferase